MTMNDERNQLPDGEADRIDEGDEEALFGQFLADEKAAEEEAAAASQEPDEGKPQEPPKEQAPPAAASEPFEGYSDLPETVRQQFDRLSEERKSWEQRWHAQHGQLAPFQRQAAQLDNERKRLAAELEAATKKARELEDANGEYAKQFAKYKESFPEEAALLEGMEGRLRRQIESGSTQFSELQQTAREAQQRAYIAEQKMELTAAHSDWRQHIASEEFSEWTKHVDQSILDKLESFEAVDNIEVMNLFKADLKAMHEWQQQQQQPPPRQNRPTRRDVPPTSRGVQSGLALPNAISDPEEAEYAAFLAANSQ